MADIFKTLKYDFEPEEMRKRIKQLAIEINQKIKIKTRWDGDVCHLSGSALKNGKLWMTDDTVSIELNLKLVAKVMKGQIEKGIEGRMVKLIDT